MDKFNEIALGVAKIHILTHNANFDFLLVDNQKGSYLAIVSHPFLNFNIEEVINTNFMPPEVAEEYVHSRIHGMAAKLLAKLYPEKP